MNRADALHQQDDSVPDQDGRAAHSVFSTKKGDGSPGIGALSKRKSRSPDTTVSGRQTLDVSESERRKCVRRVDEAFAGNDRKGTSDEPSDVPHPISKSGGHEGEAVRLVPTRQGQHHLTSLRPSSPASWPRPGFGITSRQQLASPPSAGFHTEAATTVGGGNARLPQMPVFPTASPGVGQGTVAETKFRKPYTITKQRERWTDDEHERFLEALKNYGRKWGRIADYVGTKTAVQIRSHAQKFFSRLEREKQNGNTSEELHIPPPRPKRKPPHPYPRKAPTTSNATAATTSIDAPMPETEDEGGGTSVAAVAAAACAAAAAAAAAVVAAAGQDVRAQLQASPPPGFPFFGCPPVELERQAREAVWSQSRDPLKRPDPPKAVSVERPVHRRLHMKPAINEEPLRKRVRSMEKNMVLSDGDSACSHELSDEGEYEEQKKASPSLVQPRKRVTSFSPLPTSMAIPRNSPGQLFPNTADQLTRPSSYGFTAPLGFEALAARMRQQFPESWSPLFYPPPTPHLEASSAQYVEPAAQRLGFNGPAKPLFGRHDKMVQQQLRHSRRRSASANALLASFGANNGAGAAKDGGSPTNEKHNPDSGEDVREPTSPSVHEATLKAPSQLTTQTGSGSDTVGSGQQGGKMGPEKGVTLKDSSASLVAPGSGAYRSARGAPLSVLGYNGQGKAAGSSVAGSNGNGHVPTSAGVPGVEGSSQAGSGGNGGSGGSHAGNGQGERTSEEEERSSSEPEDTQRRPAAPKFGQEQPPPSIMPPTDWLRHLAGAAAHHHHLAQLQAYQSAQQDALMQSYMEAYNVQYMNAAMAARYISGGGNDDVVGNEGGLLGQKGAASPRPLPLNMTYSDPWSAPRCSREPGHD